MKNSWRVLENLDFEKCRLLQWFRLILEDFIRIFKNSDWKTKLTLARSYRFGLDLRELDISKECLMILHGFWRIPSGLSRYQANFGYSTGILGDFYLIFQRLEKFCHDLLMNLWWFRSDLQDFLVIWGFYLNLGKFQ